MRKSLAMLIVGAVLLTGARTFAGTPDTGVALNSESANFDPTLTIPDAEAKAAEAAVNKYAWHYLKPGVINMIGVTSEHNHAVIEFGVSSMTATITSQIPPMLDGIPTRIVICGGARFGMAMR